MAITNLRSVGRNEMKAKIKEIIIWLAALDCLPPIVIVCAFEVLNLKEA
ncbi:MAG: hypothetical protein MRJ65_15380 [Candidatus Brocadiaceae bacterium]|nr:hypothetical protein [Candidatus Brocadiaceae bacterium]